MNSKGFFKEPFMNNMVLQRTLNGSLQHPIYDLEELVWVLFKEPHNMVLKRVHSKEPPKKGFFVAPFGGASLGTAQGTLKGATWHLYF